MAVRVPVRRIHAILRHLRPHSSLTSHLHHHRTRSTLPHFSLSDAHSTLLSISPSLPYSTAASKPLPLPTPALKPILPPPAPSDVGKLCVTLDMDECLLHSRFDSSSLPSPLPGDLSPSSSPSIPPRAPGEAAFTHPTQGYPYHITFLLPSRLVSAERVFVTFRPHLHRLLAQLSDSTELLLFTSALPIYAEPVLAFLTKQYGARFRHQLYRSSTVAFQSFPAFPFQKDLRTLGRDLRRTLLVDNNALAQLGAPDNAVLVNDFMGEKEEMESDDSLMQVVELIRRLDAATKAGGEGGEVGDVRAAAAQGLSVPRKAVGPDPLRRHRPRVGGGATRQGRYTVDECRYDIEDRCIVGYRVLALLGAASLARCASASRVV